MHQSKSIKPVKDLPRYTDDPEIIELHSQKIVYQGVSKTFHVRGNDIEALSQTNLAIKPKEIVAFVGPSGCGKSTMLNLLAGLTAPTTGSILYDGSPVMGLNRHVGYMTQKDTLLPWRTVESNVAIALELACRKTDAKERSDRVAEMLNLVGLSGFEGHYPAELSGGMRKRVALARTLIYRPETLMLDEPFGALDAQLRLAMLEHVQRLAALRDITVLFVTHDLGEAITLADRVVIFTARPGSIRAVKDIPIERPRDIFNARLSPQFNQLYEELWQELRDEVRKGLDAAE